MDHEGHEVFLYKKIFEDFVAFVTS